MLDLFPSKKKRFEIDMAPLIDVVFLLLIFFMLTFAIQGQGLAISLPEGEETEKIESLRTVVKRYDAVLKPPTVAELLTQEEETEARELVENWQDTIEEDAAAKVVDEATTAEGAKNEAGADAATGEDAIGLAVVDRDPVRVELSHTVGRSRMEGSGLPLRSLLYLAEHFGC